MCYLVDLQWCRDHHIAAIGDLHNRIVSNAEYTTQWQQRCAEKHARLAANPLVDMVIQWEPSPERKQAICEEILHALPDWFGIEESTREYVDHVSTMPCVTVSFYGKVVGFCALKINYRLNAESVCPWHL